MSKDDFDILNEIENKTEKNVRIEKQFVAMKAFIVDEQNDTIFLMHKGTKDALNPGKWEVPGGKMEFGETTAETFLREVREESGLDIEIGSNIMRPWQWTFTKPNGDRIQIIAVGKICRALNQKVDYSNQTDTDDLIEGRWVPIWKVLSYDLIPNLIPTMQGFVEFYFDSKQKGISVFNPEIEPPIYTSLYTGDTTVKHR